MTNQPQAFTWTNVDILALKPLGKNFSKIDKKNKIVSIKENTLKNVICKMIAIFVKALIY